MHFHCSAIFGISQDGLPINAEPSPYCVSCVQYIIHYGIDSGFFQRHIDAMQKVKSKEQPVVDFTQKLQVDDVSNDKFIYFPKCLLLSVANSTKIYPIVKLPGKPMAFIIFMQFCKKLNYYKRKRNVQAIRGIHSSFIVF